MKLPKPRGTAIDEARLHEWDQQFRFYRHPPNADTVKAWLARFKVADQDVAARILDCVEVVSEARIQEGYKSALASLNGWHKSPASREGRWVFTAFGKPGESGLSMLRIFREANGLTRSQYDDLFRHVTEIPKLKLTAADTIILVDDFSGSGKQVCKRWPQLQELIASDARCLIILTAATADAKKKIEHETELEVISHITIQQNENVFSSRCTRFSQPEKNSLLKYCRIADAQNPKGFSETGLLYVLSHKTPNNSIPILHTNHPRWIGLFPRNLQQE
ncbi:hypothetical protein [uncultured Bradyrhizobium sp.]|jgi:hypothetical protein|uniref:phosphoribosyltransferase-like protein n=1 Tax=uncultured Bradyrhizobium sp. TaxID=199684 RepID=UPI002615F191|nr:hypothetical protein [uncultured Bradyrhizobium sp.]